MHQVLESLEVQDQEECLWILEDLILHQIIKMENTRWLDKPDTNQPQMSIINHCNIQTVLEIQRELLNLWKIHLRI